MLGRMGKHVCSSLWENLPRVSLCTPVACAPRQRQRQQRYIPGAVGRIGGRHRGCCVSVCLGRLDNVAYYGGARPPGMSLLLYQYFTTGRSKIQLVDQARTVPAGRWL
jgi:hypothetical protein